ncbi:DMT family transporter [Lactobacillus selangorensis]|nr:DMT family transporter [Lactobacillus selangorensis]
MKNEKHLFGSQIGTGITWALIASTLWGISGTVLQFISQGQAIPATWFLSVRTLGAGVILLALSLIKYGKRTFAIFKTPRLIGWLLAYAIFGLMANLFTFYMSVQTGNASAATILQYLSPLFIVLGGILFLHEKPTQVDLITFGLALIGVFLAITHGDIHTLAIPLNALIWGILSGLTAAFYVVLPRPITREIPPMIVLGWALIIASVLFNLFHPVWVGVPALHGSTILAIATVILVGTILPFLALLHASNFAPSSVISILDAVQPVVTFILSLLFLNLKFNWVECLGAIIVLIAIYILQRYRTETD